MTFDDETMNTDDPIIRAYIDATNCYLAGMGLPPMKLPKRIVATQAEQVRNGDSGLTGSGSAPATARYLLRHARICPVCGFAFTLTADVTPHDADTCSPRCAVKLEQFADKHNLAIDDAAREYEENRNPFRR